MKILFERSGGFAGIGVHTAVDTDELPPQEADPLKEMVYGANFFELPRELPANQGTDRFNYRVTVEDGDREHTVQLNGGAVPDDLQPLLQHLTRLARTKK
jgi:hypothetical protein